MKLLIITQKVDETDQVLGFMVGWLTVLASQVDSLEVICLEKGKYNLPANVRVYSLGKEKGQNRLKYLFNFYRYLWSLRNKYDAIWVHMNQVYIILGWPFWYSYGKKISLWYAHGTVSLSLKLAGFLADLIFTSSASGFRLSSKKLKVVGQGIDTNKFNFDPNHIRSEGQLISIGRLSPIKKQQEIIKNLATINAVKWQLQLVGGPITLIDQNYTKDLEAQIVKLGLTSQVALIGPVSHETLPVYLRQADLFVTMSRTGSLDKVVLEAMAAGVIPVVLGATFKPVLGDYSETLSVVNEIDWSTKVSQVLSWSDKEKLAARLYLRQQIVDHHSLTNLMTQIVFALKNV